MHGLSSRTAGSCSAPLAWLRGSCPGYPEVTTPGSAPQDSPRGCRAGEDYISQAAARSRAVLHGVAGAPLHDSKSQKAAGGHPPLPPGPPLSSGRLLVAGDLASSGSSNLDAEQVLWGTGETSQDTDGVPGGCGMASRGLGPGPWALHDSQRALKGVGTQGTGQG